MTNQEKGLDLLAEAAGATTGVNIQEEEEESDHESDDKSWDSATKNRILASTTHVVSPLCAAVRERDLQCANLSNRAK